jgi:D-3-phosphoglycerate dehydrogenase
MKPKIWMDARLRPAACARLEPVADLILEPTLDNLPGVEVVVMMSRITVDAAFMDRAGPTLKIIARPGIGVDNIDIPAATGRGILVVNTPDAPTESTAEHAVALLLAVAKRVVTGDMSLRGADIPRSAMFGTEVRGRVLGIIGLGRIGRRVAAICGQGLEMRIVGYDPYADQIEAARLGIEILDSMDAVLAQADFVTLHTSLTPETRHLIDARALGLMKPGAYLINVSRGPVVDERALIKSLEAGHLAGAALDVFDPEPPLPDNPLLRRHNVVVTPHTASFTDLGAQAMSEGVTDQILQVLRGERPGHLLNPAAWPGRVAG